MIVEGDMWVVCVTRKCFRYDLCATGRRWRCVVGGGVATADGCSSLEEILRESEGFLEALKDSKNFLEQLGNAKTEDHFLPQ
jgi:hypothetical protein